VKRSGIRRSSEWAILYRLPPLVGVGSAAKGGVIVQEGVAMSEADQFRQYADEALLWAAQSKTEKEKEALIDLARTWMQATLKSESTFVVNSSPLEARAP
jgi:hypothetical protein